MSHQKKERELVGFGFDHLVKGPLKDDSEWLFKVPIVFTLILCLLHRDDHLAYFEDQLDQKRALAQKTGIQIPETRVFRTKKFYVIAQKRVKRHRTLTVADVLLQMDQETAAYLRQYDLDNGLGHFIVGEDGVIYCVDPYSSFLRRLVDKYRVLDTDRYKKLVAVWLAFRNTLSGKKDGFIPQALVELYLSAD